MHYKSNEKHTKVKTTIKINKLLHNILKATRKIYEICKVVKSIMDLFQ